MASPLIKPLIQVLKKIVNDLENNKYDCNDEELSNALEQLYAFNEEKLMSKSQAYEYLGISRASFDNYVKQDIIPKGKKVSGFKELSWKKKTIDEVAKEIRKYNQ